MALSSNIYPWKKKKPLRATYLINDMSKAQFICYNESNMIIGDVRDFTIRSNTNGLGLRSNAIKDLCPLIIHQLVVGWIGKAHGSTGEILN